MKSAVAEVRAETQEREGRVRELAAAEIEFSESPGGQLRLTVDGECSWRAVRLVRCFPVTDPDRHVAVRCASSPEGDEIGVIRDLGALRPPDRLLADRHLAGCCLLPTIREVTGLKREFGFLYWRTQPDRGDRDFATRDSQDGVMKLPDGGALVTDTDECRYLIPAPSVLSRATRALLGRCIFL
jgi:hypothetical protein